MNRDETDCKQSEDATRVSEERYRSLFENNPHPMWVYDLETLAFLEVNDAAIAHYGYSRQEFLAMTIKDIHPPEVQLDLLAAVRGIPGSFRRPGVWPERKKDGTVIDVEIVTHDMLFKGRAARLVLADDITERKRTEEALRASEDRYRRIVETAHEGIWIIDAGAKTTFVNQRMADMLGYMIGEMLYAPLHAFMDEQDYALVAGLLERRRQGISEQHEFRFRRQDGADLWAILETSPILDEHGKSAGTLAMVTDITGRKRVEEALRESEERFQLIARATNDVVWDWNLLTDDLWWNEGFRVLFGYAKEEIEPSIESWYKRIHADDYERVTSGIHTVIQSGEKAWSAEYRYRRADGSYADILDRGYVIHDDTGKPVRMIGAMLDITERKRAEEALRESEERYRDIFENASEGIFQSTPDGHYLRVNPAFARMYGFSSPEEMVQEVQDIARQLYVDPRDREEIKRRLQDPGVVKGFEGRFRRKDGALLWASINTHAVRDASGNILYYEGTAEDITERKRMEAALRASQDRYRRIVETAREGIWILDVGGKTTFVNQRMTEMLGYMAGDMLSAPLFAFVDEKDYTLAADLLERRRQSLSEQHEFRFRRRDGTGLWAILEASPILDENGKPAGTLAMVTDITERKRAEEALRALSSRQQALLAAIPDIIVEVDKNKVFTWTNPAGLEFYGEDVLGKEAAFYFEGEQDTYSIVTPLFSGSEDVIYVESWQQRKDGEKRLLAWWCRVLKDGGNVIGALSTARDITERKRAEEALRESERRLTEAQRIGKIGDWEWIPAENKVIWSAEMYAIFGIAPETVSLTTEMTIQAFHPKDRAMVAEATRKTLEELKPQPIECRILKPDGTIGYVYGRGEVVLDANGKLVKMIGIYQDITERKRAEESLRKLSRAVEQSSALIVITDPNWVFEYVNPKFTQVTGYALEQVIGKTTSILQSGKTPPETYRQLQDTLAGGGEWRGEFCNKKKNGDLYWESASISPLMNEDRVVTHFVAVKEDITERKRAEEALRSASLYARSLIEASPDPLVTISPDGKITDVNQATELVTGVSRERLVNSDFSDYFTEPEKARDGYHKVLVDGLVRDYPLTIRHTSGKTTDVLYNATVYRNESGEMQGVFAAARDITERKRAEQAQRESEMRYQIVSELTSDFAGAFRIALDGTIMREWLTGAYSRITGFNSGEMDTHGIWVTLVHPEDMRVALRHLQTLFSGQPDVCELRIVTASGEVRWLSNYGRPVWDEAQGRVIRIYSASQDITERKLAEERARREAARAHALARVAARLNAQLDLDMVLSAVCEETAHALGVPVASVMLYEPDRQVFRLAGIYGLPPQVCEQFTPVPQSLLKEYREQKGSLIVTSDLQPSRPNVELYTRHNIRTTVAASMVREEKLVGALNVHTVGDVRTFADDELALLKGLADQAAQAIANAQLFEQVKQQREQLRTLTARLAETGEEQRRRLARELHDRVGQSLTALSINLNIIRSQLPADSAQATARLDDSLRLVEETVEHTRDVMAELHPPVLDDYGLLAALRWYAERFSGSAIVDTLVEGEELDPRLPQAVEASLFRIAQEALNNVTKHAHATQASVRLEAVADMAHLTIADNGVGFDPTAKRRPGELPYWGLITMKERAEAVGGRLRVESAPGQGTHIMVQVPR